MEKIIKGKNKTKMSKDELKKLENEKNEKDKNFSP